MKADNTRFYISPLTDGGYLLEKFQDCTVVERCTGKFLNPDEVAKSLETKGFTNITVLKSPVSTRFISNCMPSTYSFTNNTND